jgi:hypothetical protein
VEKLKDFPSIVGCPVCRAPVKPKVQIEEAKLLFKNRDYYGFNQMVSGLIISDEVKLTFIEEALKDAKKYYFFFSNPAMQLSSTSHAQRLIDQLKSSRDCHAFSLLVCF